MCSLFFLMWCSGRMVLFGNGWCRMSSAGCVALANCKGSSCYVFCSDLYRSLFRCFPDFGVGGLVVSVVVYYFG